MGNPLTKPKKPGEPQKNKEGELEKVVYNYSNGDKYEGTILNGDLHGQGIYYYRNTDVYKGEWKFNKKNGWGTHYYIKQGKRYVGHWEDGLYNGEGTLYYSDNSVFRGRFSVGEKDGLGYYQEEDGKTYQEIWNYGKLVKRALVKTVIEDIQSLKLDAKVEVEETDVPLDNSTGKEGPGSGHENDDDEEVIDFNELPDADDANDADDVDADDADAENDEKRNENDDSVRNKKNSSVSDGQFSPKYSSPENKQKRKKMDSEGSGDDSAHEKRINGNQVRAPFSREFDSIEPETVKFGVDTINIMEHMEVLNSAANWLLNKPIQEWTVEDVGEWLRHLGLGEYYDKFKENHINGKNLLDLNETDLKEEFQITILGHRKTLQRNIQLLNQIHASGKNSSYVKEKIKKFYEGRKKPKFIPLNLANFNSRGRFASGKYDSKHEAIEEISDEAEFYSHSPRNQEKTSDHGKRNSVKSLGDYNGEFKLDSKGSEQDRRGSYDSNRRRSFDSNRRRSYDSNRRENNGSFASGSADSSRDERKRNKAKRQNHQATHSSGDKADEEKQLSDHSDKVESKPTRGAKEKPYLIGDVNLKDSQIEQSLMISKTRSPMRTSNDLKDPGPNDGFQLNNEPIDNNNLSSSDESSSDTDSSSSGDEKDKLHGKSATLARAHSSTGGSQLAALQTNLGNSHSSVQNSPYIGSQKGHANNSSNQGKIVGFKRAATQADPADRLSQRADGGESKRLEESKRMDEQGQQGKAKQATRKKKRRPQDKEVEEQIKSELFKILKETGLNENFIINFNELEIKNKIGEGGYGQVYRGVFSGTDVAIKEYGKRKLHRKAAEDFVKEVKVISSLRHPNIVLYMGACIHRGKYLMITEYLEEGSMFDHLHRKHTKLSEDKMLAICEDIALGMTYLHSRKVLHCDLKSSNILIDSNWSVKLCDFGLSRTKIGYKKKKKGGSKTVQRVGTPNWMAPEILRGEDYNEYSDVYSYGMVLWEMVTDEIPYANMHINEIVLNVGWEKKQVEIPTKGHPVILQIIKMCLNFDVEKRPQFKEITEKLQESLKELSKKNKNKFFGGIFADKSEK